MKFRTQMLLAFVPIFLLLGASGETVMALLERHEIRWGLDEEASSLAVSIAEFLHSRPFTDPSPRTTPGGPLTWVESLNTLMQRHQVRRLFIFGPDGRTVVRRFGSAPDDAPAPQLSANALSRLSHEFWILGDLTTWHGETTLSACAPLRAATGGIVGSVEVEIGADDYRQAAALAWKHILTGGVASLIAGLAAMGLIILPVTGGLRKLRAAADGALAGENLAPPSSRLIQEIGDLGETFGTVGTLLNEAMTKARRTLVENEQLRTAQDLAAAFRSRFDQPLQARFGGVEVAARIIGAEPGGAFHGCRETADALWAFTGVAGNGDALEQAVTASAARRQLTDALGRLSPEAAFAETGDLLPMTAWTCVSWPLKGNTPRLWAGTGGSSAGSGGALDPANPVCLHTFGPAHQPAVDACLAAFARLSASDLAENLHRLLDGHAQGAFLILTTISEPTLP